MIIGLWGLLQLASLLHARALDREVEQGLIKLYQRALDEHRSVQRMLEGTEAGEHELEGYDFAFKADNEMNNLQKKDSNPKAFDVYESYCWIRKSFNCLCPTVDECSRNDRAPAKEVKRCNALFQFNGTVCKGLIIRYSSRLSMTVAFLPANYEELEKHFYNDTQSCLKKDDKKTHFCE